MTNFAQLELPASLMKSFDNMGITTPTPIQQKTIPLASDGADILASAQTGTGKTIAYLVPLIKKLYAEPDMRALILAPTRELAMQVQKAFVQLVGKQFKTALLIGGASMHEQLRDLKRNPNVIIGTPGRINDHLGRKSLNLKSAGFLVIDEADRMLDMGFGVQLDEIATYLPEKRQTLLFSATLPPNIDKLSQRFLHEPERVEIDAKHILAPKIKQESLNISNNKKTDELFEQLTKRDGSVIVFVKTKRKAETISKELKEIGHKAAAIHGDLRQRQRERVIKGFRASKSRILVATDIAARGLDVPHVMHVINYDLPQCEEDYVHRIGRTGRAGAEGNAISFISKDEKRLWDAIQNLLDPNAKKVPFGQEKKKRAQKKRPFRAARVKRGERGGGSGGGRRKESPFGSKFAKKKGPQKGQQRRGFRGR